ncbi:MAG: family 20 glycosylhydrolase, partial [Saprospiraceae bacterium]
MKILSKLLVFFIICNLGRLVAQSQVPHNIIPQPVSVRSAPGNLKLLELKQIIIPKKSIEFRNLAEYIKNSLNMPDLKIIESKSPSLGKTKSIVISLLTSEKNKDNYALNINKNGILINAEDSKGAFYAIQSVLQLSELSDVGSIPFYIIEDESEFKYRGMHLDVSRHFFSVSFIKLYIDLLARYKLNTFHWHLTDDQGWRIEIKKYPLLTGIGSKRKESILDKHFEPYLGDNTPVEGYYTQDQIADVIKYAALRHVSIVP